MVWIAGVASLIGLAVWLADFFKRKRVVAGAATTAVEDADCRSEGPLTFIKQPQYWGGVLCVIGLVLACFNTYEVLRARPSPPISPPVERPVERPVVRFPALALQGLVYDGSNSSAVINGRVLHLGERVEGVQVIMIDRDSVWVELDGQTNRLSLSR